MVNMFQLSRFDTEIKFGYFVSGDTSTHPV